MERKGRRMKRILHMSDLHLGHPITDARFGRILQRLIEGELLKPEQTVVVVTGDIVDNAFREPGYGVAVENLDILRRSGYEVLVVPGNHDYGSGTQLSKRFVILFKEAFYGRNRSYPILDIVDSTAFIGLDSMAEELSWYDRMWAEGELGEPQMTRLERLLNEAEVQECDRRVIYLHHHPIDWQPLHRLKDSQRLEMVVRDSMSRGVSIDALLYGHFHRGDSRNGSWGVARCYDAGTATLKPRHRLVSRLPWFQVTRDSTRIIDLGRDPEKDRRMMLGPLE